MPCLITSARPGLPALFETSTLGQLLSSERVYPITLAVDRKSTYDDDDMKISADGEQLNRVGKKLNMDIFNFKQSHQTSYYLYYIGFIIRGFI